MSSHIFGSLLACRIMTLNSQGILYLSMGCLCLLSALLFGFLRDPVKVKENESGEEGMEMDDNDSDSFMFNKEMEEF